jgi:predicted Zn-dependent peptidase
MWRRDRRPQVRPPHAWHFPQPARDYLANGLQVMVFQRPGQHVASVGLVIDTPLNLEAREVEGVATLLHRCLDEGTARHPGAGFAVALEDLGAVLGGSVGHSATELFLEVPTTSLGPALALLAEMLVEPTLAEADVERHRALRLAQIDQVMATSALRTGMEFRRATVARRFRTARMAGGTADTVSAIGRNDVVEFHQRYYRPSAATIILCADFPTDPFALVDEAFDGWQGDPAEGIVHEVPLPRRPHCRLAHRPGAVQADVRLGGFGIDRGDPRRADVQVACHALGGAFLSRLNKVLREEKGFTYGVHLVNQAMRDGGLLAAQGSFRTEVVAESIALMQGILDLTAAPLDAREVEESVSFLLGSVPLRYSTARGVTDRVTTLVANGLSAEFVNSFSEALAHVVPSSATQAISDLLPPDGHTLVVVGDADVLQPQLTDAGWDVELVDRTV